MGSYPEPCLFYDAVRRVVEHAKYECPERSLTFDRLSLVAYDPEHECFSVKFTDDNDIWWIDLGAL